MKTKNYFTKSAVAGLVALISGINNGCGTKPIEGDISGLPAESRFFDRTMDIFESDAQRPGGVVITLLPDERYGGTAHFERVEILREENERDPPYSVSLVTTNKEGEKTQSIVIKDTDATFVSGEAWPARIYGRGISSTGRKVNYTETLTILYKKGRSNEQLSDEIDDILGDINNGYEVGDGVCQRGLGENEFNSLDCIPADNQNENTNSNLNENTNDNFNGNGNQNSNLNENKNFNFNENTNDNFNTNNNSGGGNTNDNSNDDEESFAERLSKSACRLLEREMGESGLSLKLYRVNADANGEIINSEQISRIGKNYFRIGPTNNRTYVIAVGGGAFQPVTAIYEAEGKLPIFYYNDVQCNYIGILNPNGFDFTVSRNEVDTEGVIDGRIQAYGTIIDIINSN